MIYIDESDRLAERDEAWARSERNEMRRARFQEVADDEAYRTILRREVETYPEPANLSSMSLRQNAAFDTARATYYRERYARIEAEVEREYPADRE